MTMTPAIEVCHTVKPLAPRLGTDMMGQTITHSGLGWANPDGTYGMAFPFLTGR